MRATHRALTGSLLASLLVLAGCGGHQSTGGSTASGGSSGGHSAGPSPSAGASSPGRAASSATAKPPSVTPSPTSSAPVRTGGGAVSTGGSSVPAGFRAYSVTYVSATTGYLLGAASCSSAPCTSVVRTTDGGASWHGVPAPRVPSTGGHGGPFVAKPGTVRDIRFASATNGWAFGGALYATHDGAGHWHKVTLPGQVLDLETGGTTAYAVVATCNSSGQSCQNERLFASPVTTDAWKQVAGVTGSGSVSGGGGELSIAGRQAYALLGTTLYARTGSGWHQVPANPCSQSASAGAIDAMSASASGSAVFALCPTGAGVGHLYVDVYRSTDGGQHWTRRAHGVDTVDAAHSLAAASAGTVALATSSVDLRGALTVSADGGATWHQAAVPNLSQGWRYVGARSGTGFVALPGAPNGAIYMSTDAGHTWHAQRVG